MTLEAPSLAALDPRAARRRQLLADLALLVVAAAWGGTFVMVKDALASAGPLTFLALRFLIATLALAPAAVVHRARLTPGLLPAGLLIGLCLLAGYGFQNAGLQHTTPSRAAFVTGLTVVLVPLGAGLVLRRPPAAGVWLGVAAAVGGLALLSFGDQAALALGGAAGLEAARGGERAETLVGDALVLVCTVGFAAHVLAVGAFADRHDSLLLAAGQIAVVAALGSALALALEPVQLEALRAVWPTAAFTGLACTVFAFVVQVRAQRFTTPTHTALIFATEPVFAALFSWLLVGEVLSGPAALGCGLILAGMVLAQLADRG